jgi:hypothetical protein
MNNWPDSLLETIWKRRQEMYKEGHEKDARWLVECRDLWDFNKGDTDGGIFFQLAFAESEVDAILERYEHDEFNKVDGIFDLSRSLQSCHDIPPDDWKKGIRIPRAR